MAQRILRPLTFGELFDEIFDLYKKNFVLLIGNVALVTIPVTLIQYLLVFRDLTTLMGKLPTSPTSTPPNPDAIFAPLVGVYAKLLFFMLIAIPLQYLMVGAVTWAVSACYLGRSITITDCYKAVLPKLPAIILTSILAGLIYIAALFCCCLPVIPAFILLVFISQVVVLEGCSGVDAIKRSIDLSRFDWLKVLGVVAIVIVMTTVVSMAISAPISFVGGMLQATSHSVGMPSWLFALQTALQAVVNTLTVPLYTLAVVLVYYDIRIRKEGFDLQLLAEDMNQAPPTNEQP